MVNLAHLQADKKLIEDNAYKVADKKYKKKLKQYKKLVKKKKNHGWAILSGIGESGKAVRGLQVSHQ